VERRLGLSVCFVTRGYPKTDLSSKSEQLYECFVDATFSKARQGGDGIGVTRIGKGVKIMLLVDAEGLPVAAYTTEAGPHESRLVQGLFDFMVSEKPERIIGDKAYDSDPLDATLAARGIAMIAPHRTNRHEPTQDGRALRLYQRRCDRGTLDTVGCKTSVACALPTGKNRPACFRVSFISVCSLLLLKSVFG